MKKFLIITLLALIQAIPLAEANNSEYYCRQIKDHDAKNKCLAEIKNNGEYYCRQIKDHDAKMQCLASQKK